MNKFDNVFFSKYISKWTKILIIIHKHIIVIIDKIIINYFILVILPVFLYYYSDILKSFIPFFLLEVFLIWMFLKWLYDIFDWYNDVWIVTEDWVVDLDWKLFSSNSVSIKYDSIEWLEIIEKWILDKLLRKADIVIHKIWWNKFILENAANAFKDIEIIDQKFKKIKEQNNENLNKMTEQNFETVMKALTKVVEWYLEDNWYKKDDNKDKDELIKKIKRKWWAIDLTK